MSVDLSHLRRLLVTLLVTIGGFSLLVAYTPLANVMALPLNRIPSNPTEADVIVVLSGGHYRDGSLNNAALERTIAAVLLYRRGLAPRILFTGGPCCGGSTSALMARLATTLGVPSSDILLEEHSLRTRDSAVESTALLSAKGLRTALLVTSPLHLLRAKLAFQRVGLSTNPVRASEKDLSRISSVDERISLLKDSLHEYTGLVFYRIRGWI